MRFSVIIPIYKAESTLERCLDSLLVQDTDDAEIILVNDGSPDRSDKICKKYAEKHSNIKYIEKENGGVSSARNLGLNIASGDYILFVDSDDWVSDDYFKELRTCIGKSEYDYLHFSQITVDGEKRGKKNIPDFNSCDRGEIFNRLAEDMWTKRINNPVAKVYKREIIEKNNIRFNENIEVGEDRTFNIEFTLNIRSFYASEKVLYFLSLENADSLSRKKRDDLDEQISLAEEQLKHLFDTKALSPEEKDILTKSINFDNMRAVYTKAKYLHRKKLPYFQRLKSLAEYCNTVNGKNFSYPSGKFCTLIALPVKLKLTPLIDAMGWVLTR